jgi:hypothetical protein
MWIEESGYVRRSDLDWYEAQLQARALGVAPVKPPHIDPDPLIPLKAVCAELGIGRRSVGRRIAESAPVDARRKRGRPPAAKRGARIVAPAFYPIDAV